MAKYGFQWLRATTNTTNGVAALEAPGSGMRRLKLYEVVAGSDASPASNAFLFQVQRSTTASSGGSTPTPNALDPADAASGAVARTGALTNGTLTAGAIPMTFPLNQQATYRWACAPGSEIVIPATANYGLHLLTPTAQNTPQASGGIMFEE